MPSPWTVGRLLIAADFVARVADVYIEAVVIETDFVARVADVYIEAVVIE